MIRHIAIQMVSGGAIQVVMCLIGTRGVLACLAGAGGIIGITTAVMIIFRPGLKYLTL